MRYYYGDDIIYTKQQTKWKNSFPLFFFLLLLDCLESVVKKKFRKLFRIFLNKPHESDFVLYIIQQLISTAHAHLHEKYYSMGLSQC